MNVSAKTIQVENKDSVYLDLQKQIKAYSSVNLRKIGFVTILNSLNQEAILSDSTLYQEIVFNLIGNAITNYKYDEAQELISFIKEKIQDTDYKQISKLFYWQSLIHYRMGDFHKADSVLSVGYRILSNVEKNDVEGLMAYLKARIIRAKYDRVQALPYFIKAVKLLDEGKMKLFYATRVISDTYAQQGNYKLAFEWINEAIEKSILKGNLNDTTFSFNNIKYLNYYAHYLQSRAYLYREMARQSGDSLNFLLKSFEDGQNSVIAIEKYKKQLNFESDILRVNNVSEYIYFKSIEAASRLYHATKTDSLIFSVYGFSEMEKASALLRSLQKDISLRSSNLSDSIIDKAYELQNNLSSLEAKRYKEKADYNIFDDKILESNIEYYKLVAEIEAFENNLESTYKEYRKNKYNVLEPNIAFVKNLSKDKDIIEYVLSTEKVYALLISDGQFYFNDLLYDKGFKDSIKAYHRQISKGAELNFSLKEQKQFIQLSHYLYTKLIEPFASKLQNKPLLIIPDNELSLIPFETLVQHPELPNQVDYGNLSYLIKDYDISYSYSITLLEVQSKAKVDKNIKKVFAMAPGYNVLSSKLDGGTQKSDYRDSLGPLMGAKKEVEIIRERIKGKHYFNKKATEEEFKRHAGEYSVLHLAMHTLINDEEPLYSKMVFTPDADSIEDGLLNTYELRELNLNADLVVLSACNTGNGKISNGEGIIGLSRGFLQSGCRSLLATLWSVSDVISIEIINGFYNKLEENKDIAVSLSEAKREYLENNQGFYTHPFFWAGFIVIGNTNPIVLSKTHPFVKLVIAFIVFVMLVLVFVKLYIRKKPEGFRLPVKLNKRN